MTPKQNKTNIIRVTKDMGIIKFGREAHIIIEDLDGTMFKDTPIPEMNFNVPTPNTEIKFIISEPFPPGNMKKLKQKKIIDRIKSDSNEGVK